MPSSDPTITDFGPMRSSIRPAVSAPTAETTFATTPKISTSPWPMP